MEYNTEKNMDEIKMWLGFIANDTAEAMKKISLQIDKDTLDDLARLCEMIGECAHDARALLVKMSEEYQYME